MNSRHEMVNLLHGASVRNERSPLSGMRLTVPQRIVLSDPSPIKLWRDGNQLGKSWWLALEVVLTALGLHPYVSTRKPPVEIMVFGVNKEQWIPLHQKIWELLPKDQIDSRCGFDPGRGIIGKPPRISFVRGPGKGSVIHFATYDQGARRAAGFTLVLAVLDEPSPAPVYGEVVPRVLRQNGRVLMGMTPTPDMADVRWLREKVEAGEISEHNFGLAVDNVWLEGSPTPLLTQRQIDAMETVLLRSEREMRMRGAWEATVEGAWLDNFIREDHVQAFDLEDIARELAEMHGAGSHRKLFICVGYDHGTQPNKEAITITAMTGKLIDPHDQRVLDDPRVWALHARKLESKATPEIIVDATLEMLEECALSVENIDVWVGDREAMSRSGYHTRIANRHIEAAWAQHMGKDVRDLPFRIETAYKPAGSVDAGLSIINAGLAHRLPDGAPTFRFHPRCEELIQACERHQGAKSDPLKDVLDAYRYPVQRVVRAGEWMTNPQRVLVA